jgi:uncharacterized cupredoxin-like copper-binding protein
MSSATRAWTVAGLVAAVAVLIASVAWALNGATVTYADHRWPGRDQVTTGQRGAASELEGSLVAVVAMDMGGRGMMHRSEGWMGGTMLLRSDRVDAPAGTVTLELYNAGAVPHEIVILRLPDGHRVGERSVGRDGTFDESASLGEASRTNGPGPGEGIDPGTTGWVTLDLAPGRYEIACNLENHYAAGMYTLLVVD